MQTSDSPDHIVVSNRKSITEQAKERGIKRSEKIREKVRAAISAIEREIEQNNGIYPHNHGALSSAEVARRAGIHPTTFFSPSQRELGAKVKHWLQSKRPPELQTIRVRRDLRSRVADWKDLYNRLAQSHRDTELALHQALYELSGVREALEVKIEENRELKRKLCDRNADNIYVLTPRD